MRFNVSLPLILFRQSKVSSVVLRHDGMPGDHRDRWPAQDVPDVQLGEVPAGEKPARDVPLRRFGRVSAVPGCKCAKDHHGYHDLLCLSHRMCSDSWTGRPIYPTKRYILSQARAFGLSIATVFRSGDRLTLVFVKT